MFISPYFHYNIFHFPSIVFSNRLQLVCLSLLLCNPFQTSCHQCSPSHFYFFWLFPFTLLDVVRKFLDIILCIKPLFPINKQFSIDSFLDWEGHHWYFAYHPHHGNHSCTSVPILSPSAASYPLIGTWSNIYRSKKNQIWIGVAVA